MGLSLDIIDERSDDLYMTFDIEPHDETVSNEFQRGSQEISKINYKQPLDLNCPKMNRLQNPNLI